MRQSFVFRTPKIRPIENAGVQLGPIAAALDPAQIHDQPSPPATFLEGTMEQLHRSKAFQSGIALVRPEPAPEHVQKALDEFLLAEVGQAAVHLELARALWREHRDLVEAPTFPEHLHAAYVAFTDGSAPEVNDDPVAGDPFTLAQIAKRREELMPLAREMAQGWLCRRPAPSA